MEITLVTEQNQKFFLPFLPNKVEIQKQDLILGAVADGTVCGVLCAKEESDLLSIQDVYVADGFRRRGVGTALLDALNQYGIHFACNGAVTEYISTNKNQYISTFLEQSFFELQAPTDPIYSLQLKDIYISVLGKQILLQGIQLISLNETTNKEWNQFQNKIHLAREGDENGEVPFLKPKEAYDDKNSFLLIQKKECCGAILFSRHKEMYVLDYFTGFKTLSSFETIAFLQMAFHEIEKNLSPETEIRINTLTEVTQKLVMKLTCGKVKKVGQAVCRYYAY